MKMKNTYIYTHAPCLPVGLGRNLGGGVWGGVHVYPLYFLYKYGVVTNHTYRELSIYQ